MAIQCHYCGTDLPKDDARFCNNCGMLIPSHPFSPQSLSAAKIDASQSPAPSQMQGEGKPVLREQVANLPPTRLPHLPAPRSGPSSWHGQHKLFEQGEQEKKGSSDTAVDELQGKLPETPKPATHEDEVVEDVPTRTMESVPSTPGGAPSRPGNTEVPNQDAYIINRQSGANAPAPRTPVPVQRVPSPPTPFLGLGPVAARENAGQVAVGSRPRGRPPILVVAILLIILIIGGIGAWTVVYQPFSIAPITRPQLSFSNTRLGIALSYPNGWTQQVVSDAAHFYASNHTAEVDIDVANAGDVNQALQQQATKMGLSGTKAGTGLTFAGTTWQQSQGNLQQSGANYTVTLLAAVHGSHLYTIVQQAPQSNYADWEKAFFSPLRGSLQFL